MMAQRINLAIAGNVGVARVARVALDVAPILSPKSQAKRLTNNKKMSLVARVAAVSALLTSRVGARVAPPRSYTCTDRFFQRTLLVNNPLQHMKHVQQQIINNGLRCCRGSKCCNWSIATFHCLTLGNAT